MQIARKLGGLQMEELLVEIFRFEPVVERGNMLHIAQMLRNERLFTARDRESVLKFGANCQQLGRFFTKFVHLSRQLDRRRRKTTGAANDLDHWVYPNRLEHAHHRIVEALDDGAIVHQEGVCNARKLLECFVFFDHDRVVMHVA